MRQTVTRTIQQSTGLIAGKACKCKSQSNRGRAECGACLVLDLVLQPGHQVSFVIQDLWSYFLIYKGLHIVVIFSNPVIHAAQRCIAMMVSILCDEEKSLAPRSVIDAARRSDALYLPHLDEIALAIVCIRRRVQKLADEVVVHGVAKYVWLSCGGPPFAYKYIPCFPASFDAVSDAEALYVQQQRGPSRHWFRRSFSISDEANSVLFSWRYKYLTFLRFCGAPFNLLQKKACEHAMPAVTHPLSHLQAPISSQCALATLCTSVEFT